ncbi:DUF3134 domain-containing protein [Chroococcidiopsis sp. FACHB-1243]|uniref:DUF3134 domain-containing protein n=1 Tax=Chroococcidiopsis sp. [FACHB-1243] TaxID=2692781 RepID=UPI00178386F7|nr:DUF3134 domain-containing protein [Chroococcidiopsis sp. [FACHB-1243]]MBD2307547.1 DUF3134 domain-containing protein [Chroococcidiopsis sp. [FACHB-1243]]
MHNSPLREEPREQPARVIPLKQESSLIDWLKSNGRLIPRDGVQEPDLLTEVEDGDSSLDLLEGDDVGDFYDDDDDLGDIDEADDA